MGHVYHQRAPALIRRAACFTFNNINIAPARKPPLSPSPPFLPRRALLLSFQRMYSRADWKHEMHLSGRVKIALHSEAAKLCCFLKLVHVDRFLDDRMLSLIRGKLRPLKLYKLRRVHFSSHHFSLFRKSRKEWVRVALPETS